MIWALFRRRLIINGIKIKLNLSYLLTILTWKLTLGGCSELLKNELKKKKKNLQNKNLANNGNAAENENYAGTEVLTT